MKTKLSTFCSVALALESVASKYEQYIQAREKDDDILAQDPDLELFKQFVGALVKALELDTSDWDVFPLGWTMYEKINKQASEIKRALHDHHYDLFEALLSFHSFRIPFRI